jgi:hypothetical protein
MPRSDPPLIIFLTCCVSHLAMVPSVVQLVRRRWMFETAVIVFAMTCSFMYHTCQSFDTRIFLTELQWHRLDNIGALCSFAVFWTYMACIKDPVVDAYIKYACVFIALLAQEKDPWNEIYTFIPIVLFSLIPVVSHVFIHQRAPVYDRKNAVLGFGLLCAALPFFVAGLDDENDPYRSFHGLWHLIGGASSFFLWRIVKYPGAVAMQSMSERPPSSMA